MLELPVDLARWPVRPGLDRETLELNFCSASHHDYATATLPTFLHRSVDRTLPSTCIPTYLASIALLRSLRGTCPRPPS
jgi:hypothetical protein